MNPVLRNIIAVIIGAIVGGYVNMQLVELGHSVFPLGENLDPEDFEAFKAAMSTAGNEHFIFPFLAHAIGTLVGAILASLLAVSHQMKYAIGIGGFFLIGGIAANIMIPGPWWFSVVDLLIAYIPMGYLGGIIGDKLSTR
jgi:hypothetical protein